MWSYYGAKTNIVHLYPPPKYGKIIEPFAGTARYALRYFDRDVLLVDKSEEIVKIWKWLQKCSERDILSLPRFKTGENINNFEYDCEEQRLIMGYLVGFGNHRTRQTATPRIKDRINHYSYTYKRVASSLFKIRHWVIKHDTYKSLENEEATWFIDPPYQHGGHCYPESNKRIDFRDLAKWSTGRLGQVIVCENDKADWMDFVPMVVQNVRTGRHSEVIWTNEPTSFGVVQKELFN